MTEQLTDWAATFDIELQDGSVLTVVDEGEARRLWDEARRLNQALFEIEERLADRAAHRDPGALLDEIDALVFTARRPR